MTTETMKVIRYERGWAGHFICANRCKFRRNTLLIYGNTNIVVSTVGLMEDPLHENKFTEIGYKRYFETIAFHSDDNDARYHDIDVTRQVDFDSPWSISEVDANDKANEMHETVVDEITSKLKLGKVIDIERG